MRWLCVWLYILSIRIMHELYICCTTARVDRQNGRHRNLLEFINFISCTDLMWATKFRTKLFNEQKCDNNEDAEIIIFHMWNAFTKNVFTFDQASRTFVRTAHTSRAYTMYQRIVHTYDDGMMKRWRKKMSTLQPFLKVSQFPPWISFSIFPSIEEKIQ